MTKVERPEVVPMQDRLADELDAVLAEALKIQDGLVEPTEGEKKNGWTAETLTHYLIERKAGQSLDVDVNSLQRKMGRRPIEQDHKYNPLRWRG